VKKHLRIATAAFAALSLALVGCETDDNGDGGLEENGIEDDGLEDDGLEDDGLEDDGLEEDEDL
jgi:hypothetical protein